MFASTFENQERAERKKKTAIAIGATLLLHGAIALFLFLFIIHTPIPPFPDMGEGVEVNFGFDETGSGDVQATSPNPGQMQSSNDASASNSQPSAAEDNLLVQENGDEDVVVPDKKETPVKKPEPNSQFKPNNKPTNANNNINKTSNNENPNPQPSSDPNALFQKGAYGPKNGSNGDGNKGGAGDQGDPNGNPNSHNYEGDPGNGNTPGPGGLGNGGFSLKGRKSVALPAPEYCSEQGKVIIDIKVDRTGKVVNASLHRAGSTAINKCSIDNAIEAAKRAKFNPDNGADEFQFGTITYIYKVK
ncbi:MAG: energy transducer TonB [Chitinophagales bacterium]